MPRSPYSFPRSLSPRAYAALAAMLAVLMAVTRVSHFGDALHLPDASMAVFFLGGLVLHGAPGGARAHLPFLAFAGFAGLLDWASISLAGTSDFCVTAAYSFLLPAYAVLWYGGRWAAARLDASPRGLLAMATVALVSASGSFVVSNGAFYWLGGRYEDPHMAEYLERLWHWGPLFVRTTMGYVAVALAVFGVARVAVRRPRAVLD